MILARVIQAYAVWAPGVAASDTPRALFRFAGDAMRAIEAGLFPAGSTTRSVRVALLDDETDDRPDGPGDPPGPGGPEEAA